MFLHHFKMVDHVLKTAHITENRMKFPELLQKYEFMKGSLD